MQLLDTKYKIYSARITALIVLIIVLLLFIVGGSYMDPPEEYGVAVNFGTTDYGKGNQALAEPQESQPEETPPVEEVQPEETTSEPTETTKTEEVITQESEEAIALKKQKEAEVKAKAEADRKAEVKRKAEEKKRKEEAEKKKKLDQLIGNVKNSDGKDKGGEGDDDKDGNKGKLNGDPYAPSYFGGSGPGKGGVGYGLGGRGRPSKNIFKQDCNEYGLVVVKIEVNQKGEVTNAVAGIKGTTNTHPCLLNPAKRIAMSHKWPADANAPTKQVGFVSINFAIGQ